MLTRDELIKQISATIGKAKVLELSKILRERKFGLRDLIDITFHQNKDIAFRAAWLLENVFLADPAAYLTDLEYLLSKIKEVGYHSCQRHYAKIVMHITANKAPDSIKIKLRDINLEPVIEKLFDWMTDPNIKIAVKVFASECLFNLREQHVWITDELTNQVKYLMRNGTPAIQSRGKKILSKLDGNKLTKPKRTS